MNAMNAPFAAGVSIAELAPTTRIALRIGDPASAGLGLPTKIGVRNSEGGRTALCLGPDEWLRPYTDETVKGLAKTGIKRMAVVAPGFTADCLETLEELNVENRHIFTAHGGEDFAYLPCLNDGEEGMRVIRHIVERELRGWIDA